MKIGVISDTHDHVDHIDVAIRKFSELGIDTILHAGDYCSPFTIPPFEGFTLIGVFGNNDGDHFRLIRQFRNINGEIHNEFHELTLGGRKIALYHGTREPITNALVQCGNYDLVITGHTHTPEKHLHGQTLSFNPGSVHGFRMSPTIGVYDTEKHKAEHIELTLLS